MSRHEIVLARDEHGGPTKVVHFSYDSDLSGDVTIEVETDEDGTYTLEELRVPAVAILEFVGSRLRDAAVSALEGADWKEFLTL